jgi:hypothetical protein
MALELSPSEEILQFDRTSVTSVASPESVAVLFAGLQDIQLSRL